MTKKSFNKPAKLLTRLSMFTLALSMLISFFPCIKTVDASQSKHVQFSVRTIQSDKQVDKAVTYFDLRLSPGEEHVLELDVINSGSVPLSASVGAYTAGTNPGGVIEYSNPNVSDDSLVVSFADIAVVDNPVVNVAANSSSRVKVAIKMPSTSFDGVMLGGIAVKQLANATVTADSGASITNEYCYIIGTKIRVNDSVVMPDFKLRGIEPKLSNYRTSIAANLQNFKAAIANRVAISAEVYSGDETQPMYTSSAKTYNVAPNSNFDYIIPWEGKLAAGNYRLRLTASHKEQSWEFDEEFTIAAPAANDLNNQAVNTPSVNYYRFAALCLAGVLIMALAFVVLWFFVNNQEKEHAKNE